MLTHNQIETAIGHIAPKYNVKSVAYFGSYAKGTPSEHSDLDLLVEFADTHISLYDLIELETEIEETLHTPIDIATFPLPKGSRLIVDKAVTVYGS